MHPDAGKLLWDAQQAAARVARFTSGRTFADYEADEFLRSAVERQFEIVGEALNHLSRVDPKTAPEIAELPRVIAFRTCSRTVMPRSTIELCGAWSKAA